MKPINNQDTLKRKVRRFTEAFSLYIYASKKPVKGLHADKVRAIEMINGLTRACNENEQQRQIVIAWMKEGGRLLSYEVFRPQAEVTLKTHEKALSLLLEFIKQRD